MLVIGDVVCHNVYAAAAMGQIRSITRGIAYDRPETPALILQRVEDVLAGLRIGTLATALIARIEQSPDQAAVGQRTLRWSSAGHPPPAACRAGGRVEFLHTEPELLLGSGSIRSRTDHTTTLHAGDTLVFYTDGLIEHGRTDIDAGTARLATVLAEAVDLPVDQLCDRLLERILTSGSTADDDVALVAVHCQRDTDAAGTR